MTAPARTAAYRALQAIDRRHLDLPAALAAARRSMADQRDQALTAEIVTGTLRWRAALDHAVLRVATRPIAAIDPDVLTVLRLSLYQIFHLDRVPASAVVDDAVNLVRAARKSSATGFVNAVLRTTLRTRRHAILPARPADATDREAALDYLSVTQSHPRWLVARWLDRYGLDAADAWVQFNNAQAPLTLRALGPAATETTPADATADGTTDPSTTGLGAARDTLAAVLAAQDVHTEPTRWAPDGLTVTSGTPLRDGGHSGYLVQGYLVQDEASQLVALVVGAQPGQRVLDLCAAPGGKTTALAAAVGHTGRVVACDSRKARVALLCDTVRRTGTTNVRIVRADARMGVAVRPVFDRVLVDVLCSGLGTLRRDPDIKWRREAADLIALAHDQLAILRHAMQAVGPAGRLVYATCSSEPEENEDVVHAALALEPGFRLRRPDPHPALAGFIDEQGAFRTVPFAHGLEAFYAATLERI